MSVITLKGHPIFGMPKKTSIRVEELPRLNVVWMGEATRSASIDLDPGKYVATFHTDLGDEIENGSAGWREEFYVDVDEVTWKKLQTRRPMLSRSMGTTMGPVWHCGAKLGCKHESRTVFAAYAHEQEHFGVDVLDPKTTDSQISEAFAAALAAKEDRKKANQVKMGEVHKVLATAKG